jgi:hypothetical protein
MATPAAAPDFLRKIVARADAPRAMVALAQGASPTPNAA